MNIVFKLMYLLRPKFSMSLILLIKCYLLKLVKLVFFLKVMHIKTKNVVKTVIKRFLSTFCLMFLDSKRNFIQ